MSMTHTLKHLLRLGIIVVIGLLSRRVAIIPAWIGDALWAIAVYETLCLLTQRSMSYTLYITALAIAYLVEYSQLLDWEWLVTIRNTTIGHLLLGQGFLWSDLVAYTIGISVIAIIEHLFTHYSRHFL